MEGEILPILSDRDDFLRRPAFGPFAGQKATASRISRPCPPGPADPVPGGLVVVEGRVALRPPSKLALSAGWPLRPGAA